MSKRPKNQKKSEQDEKRKKLSGSITNSSGTLNDDFKEIISEDPRVQLVQVDFEKQAAEQEAGQEEQVYGFWGKIYKFYNWKQEKTHGFRFKKKTYMWLLFLTGWAGGHRWYQGRRYLGLFETLFFWTGLPFILCVSDFMEVFPIQPDEEGYIVL